MENYLVVAIDTQLRDHLQKQGFNVYYRDVKVSATSVRFLSVRGSSGHDLGSLLQRMLNLTLNLRKCMRR